MDGSGSPATRTILVTGATGYVGGRLIPRLLEQGYRVRCLARDAARIEGRGWKQIEVVTGDVLSYETLLPALQGVDTAYYLVHSMAAGEQGFEERDIIAAQNFGLDKLPPREQRYEMADEYVPYRQLVETGWTPPDCSGWPRNPR